MPCTRGRTRRAGIYLSPYSPPNLVQDHFLPSNYILKKLSSQLLVCILELLVYIFLLSSYNKKGLLRNPEAKLFHKKQKKGGQTCADPIFSDNTGCPFPVPAFHHSLYPEDPVSYRLHSRQSVPSYFGYLFFMDSGNRLALPVSCHNPGSKRSPYQETGKLPLKSQYLKRKGNYYDYV